MKLIVLAALACVVPAAAFAQTAPAAPAQTPPGVAAPTAAAKLSLDTPIETLVADAEASAVLEANLPGIANHPAYDQFKAMSLRQVQPFSEGQLTDEAMKKIEAGLAALK